MCSVNGNMSDPTPAPAPDAASTLDQVLDQLGYFQLYQKYVLFLICIPNMLGAMYSLNYIFVADEVPFRCWLPECAENPPSGSIFNSSLTEPSACHRYPPLYPDLLNCTAENFDNSTTVPCEHFLYENMDTIFSEFDLACRDWLRTLVGTVRNSALPVALLITGYLSDSRGRLTTFCLLSLFAGVMGIIKSFSINYHMYLAMEFLEAALGYGFNSAAYVLVLELARPSLRATFACATGMAYGFGGVLLAGLAYVIPTWRQLLRWMHAPALILPIYWLLLDESPRWLHTRGRTDDVLHVIRRAARWNSVTLDSDLVKKLETESHTVADGDVKKQNPWIGLVKSKQLMIRFVLCSFCWVATTFVYYGLTINSVSLAGDKHVNFALNMAMEIVASLLIMMALERLGRKRCIFVAFLLCGIACVIPYFIAHSGTGLGLFFVGKLTITFAFNSVYVFTAELFPTGTRSTCLAACSLVGRVGSILAPQTPLLNVYVQALLFGGTSLVAALLVLLIPETQHVQLPHDVTQAEDMRPRSPSPAPVRSSYVTPSTGRLTSAL